MDDPSLILDSSGLRKARESRGLSIIDLAKRANVSATTILRTEAGKDPRLSTWRKILEAFEGE